jgi:hypothetical protein
VAAQKVDNRTVAYMVAGKGGGGHEGEGWPQSYVCVIKEVKNDLVPASGPRGLLGSKNDEGEGRR